MTFCLGYPRTGTTSFGDAMERLNLQRMGWGLEASKLAFYWAENEIDKILSFAENSPYQVFEDVPWSLPGLYAYRFSCFPSARFVLMTRDENDWFRSFTKAYPSYSIGVPVVDMVHHRWHNLFFMPVPVMENAGVESLATTSGKVSSRLIHSFRAHHANVLNFFERTDPSRLLVLDLRAEDKMRRICELHGIDYTGQDYPWVNSS